MNQFITSIENMKIKELNHTQGELDHEDSISETEDAEYPYLLTLLMKLFPLSEVLFKFNYNPPKTPSAESILEEMKK